LLFSCLPLLLYHLHKFLFTFPTLNHQHSLILSWTSPCQVQLWLGELTRWNGFKYWVPKFSLQLTSAGYLTMMPYWHLMLCPKQNFWTHPSLPLKTSSSSK
jgi:hypothetical protein